MKALENAIYVIGVMCAFIYGFVKPILTPLPPKIYENIAVFFTNNHFVAATVVIACAALSAAAINIMVRIGRNQPKIARFCVKVFVLMLPAVACGIVFSIILVFLGMFKTTQSLLVPGLGAVMYLCGGFGGITAMNSIPEYRRDS